jgi:F-type H+-transporting ATPase subunit delta
MDVATGKSSAIDAYAGALLNIASAEEDPAAAVDEIYRAAVGLSSHAELMDTLVDPRIPGERKQGILNDLLESRASRATLASMNFVVSAGQSKNMASIAARVAELAADAEGEVVAEVRTPLDLDQDQIDRLQTALSSATNKRVQVKVVVDPSVIGGVVTKVGDTMLDGSVRGRFSELREQWG